jgi:septum formation protein
MLILASASPRRADLLRSAGFEFPPRIVDVDESVRPGDSPGLYVRRLAAEKSFAASAAERPAKAGRHEDTAGRDEDTAGRCEELIILAADTAVVIDGEILGKPTDDRDAERMLRLLSGRTHDVLTGVSVRCGAQELGRVERTRVEITQLSDAELAWYIATGEGRDKAGAYAIQGLASRFVRRVDGSYSNVVGLPVATVHELVAFIASGR